MTKEKIPTFILLAGGNSSRLRPLREKNLFTFLGESLILHQIKKLKEHRVKNIIIITNENNFHLIKKQVASCSINITMLAQKGTGQAGACMTALENLKTKDAVIMNMNDIFDNTLFDNFFAFLKTTKRENALVGILKNEYFPGGYLVFDNNKFIKKVIEKPGAGKEPSKYVRIVFDYFFDVNILKRFLETAKSNKDDVYEVALTNMMSHGEKFRLIEHTGTWKTIKYPWHILSISDYFLSTIKRQKISNNVFISKNANISGNVIIESGVKIFDNATIKGPTYIGKNTIIGNNSLIRNSHIGQNCVIGYESEIARSYIADKSWFHKNYIGDSIIANNVSFGSNALTANLRLDESVINVNIKGTKTLTGLNKLGAIIGDNVRIGVGALLMPGIKIGANSIVGPGVVLTNDIDDNTSVFLKQSLNFRKNKFDISNLNRDSLKKTLK